MACAPCAAQGVEAGARISSAMAEALQAEQVVHAATGTQGRDLALDSVEGAGLGQREIAHADVERVAAQVAAAQLVAVGVARAQGHVGVAERCQRRGAVGRGADPLLSHGVAVLEPGDAELARSHAQVTCDAREGLRRGQTALGHGQQHVAARAAVGAIGRQLTHHEVLGARAQDAAAPGQVGGRRWRRHDAREGGRQVQGGRRAACARGQPSGSVILR